MAVVVFLGLDVFDWIDGGMLHDRLVLSATKEVLGNRLNWRSLVDNVFNARQRSGALGGLRVFEV